MLVHPQSTFLSNLKNKERSIAQLTQCLKSDSIEAIIVEDNAHVYIVRKAVDTSQGNGQVVIVGQEH